MSILKEYFARAGSRFSKEDAAVIGPALDELRDGAGFVADEDILSVAHSPNHPLHQFFEWNDKRAAHKYRLGQAREMTREIRVRTVGSEERPKPVARVRTNSDRHNNGRPTTLTVFGGESGMALRRMQDAIQDLEVWRQRYEPYVPDWKLLGDDLDTLLATIGEFIDGTSDSGDFASRIDSAMSDLFEWRQAHAAELSPWIEAHDRLRAMIDAISDVEARAKRLPGPKKRHCLRCQQEFASEHAGHRLCDRCKQAA